MMVLGNYIVRNEQGDEMTLSGNENVYFSTVKAPYWETKVEGATPVSHSDVFVEDPDVNKELLRSDEYTKTQLINLIEAPVSTIVS